MRHGKKFNHLGRKAPHRKAMLSNMASSLLISEKKRIITTLAKAKALRTYVEPLITKARKGTTHHRRQVFSLLQNKDAVKQLFLEVVPKIGDRPGGYVRILKLGPRQGDNAEMALVELVDFNEFITEKSKPSKSRRRRGGGKSKAKNEAAPAAPKAEEAAPAAEEAPAAEAEKAPETTEEAPAAEAPEAEGGDTETPAE